MIFAFALISVEKDELQTFLLSGERSVEPGSATVNSIGKQQQSAGAIIEATVTSMTETVPDMNTINATTRKLISVALLRNRM